ncbi:pilus assembly protein TadG-related protein [Mechercharimyces sp. CAU 1602]|uniref:pilus assembly protein TadG-related protein n=1 Tax=Mechercharimyces sp. CAU 1602 TaxID=2973933 RepID=UPI002162F0E6|nr:pilus assembly protein TadG-related protein [Mechercharimyces sp. CAU 1602]MCS1352438.1 pilus assembly protein TadG-related protein [Mechercharimyces sp. CAU 1602]
MKVTLKKTKGNITTLWVAGLPLFMLVLLFLSTLVNIWISHSASLNAADAASLAATKKLDEWYDSQYKAELAEVNRWNFIHELGPGDPGYRNPYHYILGTDDKKTAFMKRVVANHKIALQQEVKKYLKKHSADKGWIVLSVNDRVEIIAESAFEPLILEEEFREEYVKGTGTGPKRIYLEWLPERSIKIPIK